MGVRRATRHTGNRLLSSTVGSNLRVKRHFSLCNCTWEGCGKPGGALLVHRYVWPASSSTYMWVAIAAAAADSILVPIGGDDSLAEKIVDCLRGVANTKPFLRLMEERVTLYGHSYEIPFITINGDVDWQTCLGQTEASTFGKRIDGNLPWYHPPRSGVSHIAAKEPHRRTAETFSPELTIELYLVALSSQDEAPMLMGHPDSDGACDLSFGRSITGSVTTKGTVCNKVTSAISL
ncbi:hypothetical protein Bbelb_086540 [Branchiostoma belcheri]|nr:hypothetical protein Bbelb_086540 [Branchiostoma belcheri]